MSRPMANPPKLPKASRQLSPATLAKKMEKVRAGKKRETKQGGTTRGGKAAVPKESAKAQAGRVGEIEQSGEAVETGGPQASTSSSAVGAGGVGGSAAAAPTFIFSSTNNNRQALQEEKRRERERDEQKAALRKENMRLHNPDGETPLVIVPAARPKRSTRPAQTKGPVVSLTEQKRARDDVELLARMGRDSDGMRKDQGTTRKSEGKKRKAEVDETSPKKRYVLGMLGGGAELTMPTTRAKSK